MRKTSLGSWPLAAVLFALPASSALPQQTATPAYLETRDVAHGAVQTFNYHSESLDREREVVVYMPPGYESGSERYPVLYLLHGAGGDERTWIDRQQANVILDNSIADGRLEPLVVVMPYGYTRRLPEGQRRRGAAAYKTDMEEFAVDFIEDLIPQVESRYRVLADAEHRAIAGLSMGGGQSLAIGLSHPEMFTAVAGFSSAMQIANNPDWGGVDMEAVLANDETINEHLDLLWVGCGTEDGLFDANKAFSEQLTEHGVEHTFRVTLGGHTAEVWSRYLYEVAPQLF
ncbi:MAG TPA: alpha/beta hydrolase-fold protein [Gammaproteobacteria bacterium]